jgi:23S rRNA (pseudouridine1915-N3)-methyltransferase
VTAPLHSCRVVGAGFPRPFLANAHNIQLIMKINLIAIGTKMPAWINAGFCEYQKRFPKEFELRLIEIPAVKHIKNINAKNIIEQEGKRILDAIPRNNHIIALDVRGAQWSTKELASQFEQRQMTGCDISLLVGGAEGLSPTCLEKANSCWSLSKLTFPHMLVRVIVAEQLYRAITILKKHPYHR